MNRTITISEHGFKDLEKFIQLNGEGTNEAIGYLSTWSMASYPEVKIYVNYKEHEIIANYYNKEGNLGYQIGAIYREDEGKFSFHS